MIKIVKNFLEKSEKNDLLNWALDNYKNNFFISQRMNPNMIDTRKSTRNSDNNFMYPEVTYKVQKKIIDYFNLQQFQYPPVFKDGIVCGVGENKDSVYLHKDPVYYKDTYTIHANFIIQKPENGGVTIINGKEYDIDETDMLLFTPSHLYHEVNESLGNTKRVLWCYGFCVNEEIMKKIFY